MRSRNAARFGHRDSAPGAEVTRRAGERLGAHVEQGVWILPEAHRSAHAEIGAAFQVACESFTRWARVDVRVDNCRHHGLAGKAHARGARRYGNISGPPYLHDFRAIYDQRRVLDWAAFIAHDKPRTFERSDALRARRIATPAKNSKNKGGSENGYRNPAHRSTSQWH